MVSMKSISFGSTIDSCFYELDGETYYKIFPLFGYMANIWLNEKISLIAVLSSTDNELTLKSGNHKVKISFKPYMAGLEKITVKSYFLFFPLGWYFGEISKSDKSFLKSKFKISIIK